MFFYLADLHISDTNPINRQDSVKDASLYKLEYVLLEAQRQSAKVVLGGDIFETPKPSYSLLNAVMGLLKKYNVPVFSIIGNHDVMGSNITDESSAIFTLFKSGLVKRTSEFYEEDVVLKGLDYTKEIPTEYYFDKQEERKKILIVHTALLPVKALFPHILLEDFKTNANLVLCSNIHKFWCKKVGNTLFLSSGCMTRLKINEKDNEPLYFVIDTKNKPMVQIKKIPLPYKADFVEKSAEDVVSVFGGSLVEEKIESPNIEKAILSSTYTQEVKDFCIGKINEARTSL